MKKYLKLAAFLMIVVVASIVDIRNSNLDFHTVTKTEGVNK